MTARILVVDDILPNRKLLEARLTAEYFEVLSATSGPEALAQCRAGGCDLVLLDVMMPGMDGFEVCRRLKADAETAHIPVVMVTALDQPADRVRGLEAGADDFLTKPVDELALLARVRSLARLKVAHDELRARAATSVALGLPDTAAGFLHEAPRGRILLVDNRAGSFERILQTLSPLHDIALEQEPQEAVFRGVEEEFDLFIVSLGLQGYDGLRLCSQIRSLERTRHLPLLMLSELDGRDRVLRGLDLGANDYLMRPIDKNELIARVRTQVRRKRTVDMLRDSLQTSLEMAVVDPLTGLNNRRYLETHLSALLARAVSPEHPLSLMVLDIDFFKAINDTYGHAAGDHVLKSFAARIKRIVRQRDLACRFGGEEFVVVMPDTPIAVATVIAERVRAAMQGERFPVDGGRAVSATVSAGLAEARAPCDMEELFRCADRALYRSKHNGRNRVTADAA